MKHEHDQPRMKPHHYRRLFIMAALSFAAMFVLMYAMVDTIANVYANLNQVYMAGLMTASMVVIELSVMRAMYQDRKRNTAIMIASVVVMLSCWIFIRQQTAISDRQFLKSMIPHHASAILMCKSASHNDPQVEALCESIISSQQAEITLMKARLAELNK